MQEQNQLLKKWTLKLNGVVRARVILPADMDNGDVIAHLSENHKNSHRWPKDVENLQIELTGHYVKQAYVKDTRRENSSRTQAVKFSEPAFTYELVKVYK